jgi:MFS transporter, DHA2 family, multidrug resistance protein
VATTWDDPKRWWALAVLVSSVLVIGLDTTVAYVALPGMAALHATNTQLMWVFAAYLVIFAGAVLPFGAVADHFGRKRVLLGGLAVFGVASTAAAAAHTPAVLVSARAVMGAGAAVIMSASLAMLPVLFAPGQRVRAFAVWSAGISLGLPVGPLAAGWLAGHFWWGSVFLINVPIAGMALVAGWFLLPESRDPAKRTDMPGSALVTAGLAASVYGITLVPSSPWLAALCLGGGALLLALFVWWERRAPQPLVPMAVLGDRRFTGPALVLAVAYLGLMGFLFMLTPYLETVRHISALGTGVRLLLLMGALILGVGVSERAAARASAPVLMTLGLPLVSAGLLLFAKAGTQAGSGYVSGCLVAIGLGLGLALSAALRSSLGALPGAEHKAGMGVRLTNFFRQAGGAIGVAVFGTILGPAGLRSQTGSAGVAVPAVARGAYLRGMDSALVTGAVVIFLAAALALGVLRRPRTPRPPVPGSRPDPETPGDVPALSRAAGPE